MREKLNLYQDFGRFWEFENIENVLKHEIFKMIVESLKHSYRIVEEDHFFLV